LPRLVGRLAELFPGPVHVFDTDLAQFTPDETIWEYARSNGLVIVTADSDFPGLAEERGAPPKIVRLENCNYRTSQVEDLLRRNAVRIAELERSSRAVLVIRNTA
jgi:predicted nuclease of predicted toxin-antitoxin system